MGKIIDNQKHENPTRVEIEINPIPVEVIVKDILNGMTCDFDYKTCTLTISGIPSIPSNK